MLEWNLQGTSMDFSLILLALLTILSLATGLYTFLYAKSKRRLWIGSFCLAFIFFVFTYLKYAASV